VTYAICSFFESGDKGDLSGLALLVSVRSLHPTSHLSAVGLILLCIQGGTFLYVATVLQPVSRHSPVAGEMRRTTRVSITVLGMFIPLLFRALFNHEHRV